MATPDRWSSVLLGDAGEWLSGGTPSKADANLWDGPVPWVSPKDMKRSRIGDAEDHVSEAAAGNGTRLVPENTLLMVVRGMILAHTFPVAITTAPVTFNQDVKALRPSRAYEPDFLLHWLQAAQSEVLKLVDVANHGTKRLPTERLHAMEVPLPPLPEQRKIAAILSSVDETIEKTEAVIDQLEVVKKAMMEELLTRGMPGRHTRFRQTEIGEIPEGWEVVRLEQVAVVQTGIAKGKAAVEGATAVPYLRVANLQDQFLDLREVKTIDVSEDQVERYRLRVGDVLFCEGGDADKVGRGSVWQGEVDVCLHQNHVFAVRPRRDVLSSDFLSVFRSSARGRRYFLDCAKQTTNLASINSSQLKSFLLPLPTVAEQEAIVQVLAGVSAVERAEAETLSRMRSTKAALASSLLSGELRVTPDEAPR